jgi:hypothetical protein
MAKNITDILGKDASYLLEHKSKTISKDQLIRKIKTDMYLILANCKETISLYK